MPGELVGGFRVGVVLGAGAMGVVYEAFDLALDRRVALKLHMRQGDDVRATRMWREAKAMARLAHPNVIAVHEVGEYEGQVFIAMELVEGGTLREWLRDSRRTPRSWREVLHIFVQAAEGLAAAHAGGLVHRDFKPDNVLIGRDGRVRVADFGLARAAGEGRDSTMPIPMSGSPSLDERLTQTGVAVGTPAYMAPEQQLGAQVDHRVDQFAFCVALYEALYGQHPFGSMSLHDLPERMSRGQVRPPPSNHGVPSWLHAVIVRGLCSQPGDRYPSMRELLVALRADPSRRRTRIALGLGGVTALGMAVVLTWTVSSAPAPCGGMVEPMDVIWNPTVAENIEQALRDTGSPLAQDTLDRVRPALDQFAQAWGQQRTEACEATRVRGEQSEAMLDRRMVCLDRRRQQLEAVIEVLATPDADVIQHAVRALEALGSLTACADLESLQALMPPPDDEAMRDAVSDARAEVAAIEVAARAGRVRAVHEQAEAAVERARELGYAPLLAEAYYARHLVSYFSVAYPPAIADATAAHRWAAQVGHVRLAWRSAISIAQNVGRTSEGTEEALRWLEVAKGWGQRFEFDPADRAFADRAMVDVLHKGGRISEATEVLERSLTQLEARDASAPTLANHYVGMVYLLTRESRLEEARTYVDRAIELVTQAHGPNHPQMAKALSVVAQLDKALGQGEDALLAVERGLQIRRQWGGEDSIIFALALRERGDILQSLKRIEQAIVDYEHALRILEAVEHREPGEEIMTMNNLANALSAQGQEDRALIYHQRVLERSIETDGERSLQVAQVRLNYGSSLFRAGRLSDGVAQSLLALELLQERLGPSHTNVGIVLLNLARSYVSMGKPQQARSFLSRAAEIFEANLPPDHHWHARVADMQAALLEHEAG